MGDIKTPWNPSKRAIARVKNPLPAPEQCNCCGSISVSIVNNSAIYGRSHGKWPWAYRCDYCRAYVGMHPFTDIPLGTLADTKTREARKACKLPFIKIYESGILSRNAAYKALSEKLGIAVDECHFGWFDSGMCERAAIAAWQIIDELEQVTE